jgi:hypothetical protein
MLTCLLKDLESVCFSAVLSACLLRVMYLYVTLCLIG